MSSNSYIDSYMITMINKYFNDVLRNNLKYPEKFTISIINNDIIFNSDIKSELIKKLSNIDFKNQLKNIMVGGMKLGSSIIDINITVLSDYTFKIILICEIKFNDINIDAYAQIAKHLDLDGINSLCRTDTIFNDYCNNNTFWSILIKYKYPDLALRFQDINQKKIFYENCII